MKERTFQNASSPKTETGVTLDRQVKNARIDRRTLLRGMGVSLALPSLNLMQPVGAMTSAGSTGATPVRLAWVFFPNGTNADRWFPKTVEGSDWELSPSLEPLAECKADINVLKGLAQVNAQSLGDGPGDHARSAAAFLTGAHPFKTDGAKIRAGRSADQIAADTYGRATRLASIELGTEAGRDAGGCDSGYSCAYSNNISWRSESLPMSKEVNPLQAFQRLFGAAGSTDSRVRNMQSHILDFVSDQRKHLEKIAGAEDRRKLEEYFTSVREIEQRINRFSEQVKLPSDAVQPKDKPSDATEHIHLMYDLMVLAFQTDTTRIATFMLANEGSGRTFPMIDVKEGHHQLSHHENQQNNIDKIAKIDKYYAEQFCYFLKKLRSTADGDSNLLDNSLIVYGGCISDGNRHDHHNLPILLAGKGGNRVETGRLVEYPKYTPLNNLFSTMLDIVGVKNLKFGDGTGLLNVG